jgi:soluble lytic murein transglycosylase-like protein
VKEAAEYHGVSAQVVKAIIWHESINKPNLVLKNRNGSVDIGLGGINSIHYQELGRYNVQPEHLLDGCVNAYVTAWLLAKKVARYGHTWEAVGAYHSETPAFKWAYAKRIERVLSGWGLDAASSGELQPGQPESSRQGSGE